MHLCDVHYAQVYHLGISAKLQHIKSSFMKQGFRIVTPMFGIQYEPIVCF